MVNRPRIHEPEVIRISPHRSRRPGTQVGDAPEAAVKINDVEDDRPKRPERVKR